VKNKGTKATAVIIIIVVVIVLSVALLLVNRMKDSENSERYDSLLVEISQGNEEAFREAVSLYPQRPIAYLERAVWLLHPDTIEECIDFITRAFTVLSTFEFNDNELQQIGSLYSILGSANIEISNYQNAIISFSNAVNINPQGFDMHRDYIIALIKVELIDEANSMYDKFMNEQTEDDLHFIHEHFADAYYAMGDYEKAMEYYLMLHQERGINFITWQNIGVLHQHFGDFHAARLIFTGMMLAYPDDYRPPMRLAYLAIDEQLLLDNDDQDYSEVLRMYNLSQTLNDTDDVDLMRLSGIIAELRQHGWLD